MCVLGPGSPGSSSEEYSLEVSVSMFSRRVVMGAASWACSSGSGSGFGSSSLVMANPTEAKVSDCGTRSIGALAERTTLNPFSFSPRARPSFCLIHDLALLTAPLDPPVRYQVVSAAGRIMRDRAHRSRSPPLASHSPYFRRRGCYPALLPSPYICDRALRRKREFPARVVHPSRVPPPAAAAKGRVPVLIPVMTAGPRNLPHSNYLPGDCSVASTHLHPPPMRRVRGGR
jgi:hypothetical protein